MRSMKIPALALTGVLAVAGLAACGSSNDSSTGSDTSTSSTSAASTSPKVDLPDLSKGVSTAVTLDQGFLDGITKLGVTPGTLGTATLTGAVLSFPITGGHVKYYTPGTVTPYVQGEIDHDGSGISLTAGGHVVNLENFVVDPGKSMLTGKVTVNGKTAAPSAPLFFLDGRTLKPLAVKKSNNTAVLEGTTVKLTQEAADLLNKTFKIDALKKNLVIGVAKITINAS
jgi:hypothetical protein